MTDLNPDPFIVPMVQVATTLPMFLFAMPAGALADIVDRRTWRAGSAVFSLNYPSRRQVPLPLQAFIEFLRENLRIS